MQFGPPVQCFWLEPTERVRLSLRRYRSLLAGETCSNPYGYHDASVAIGEAECVLDEDGYLQPVAEIPHDDPRWATRCVCGYAFVESDAWQCNQSQIYRRLDTGAELTIDEAPPGAMWNAWWCGRGSATPKPDEIRLMVRCPSVKGGRGYGDWYVDGPASNGPGWTRTGVANSATPTVTAYPSIGIGTNMEEYHGWLRNGRLESV